MIATCPPRERRRLDRNPGFTLLELLVVISLIALVSGAVVLRVEGYFRQAAFGKTMDLVRTLDAQARREASQRPAGQTQLVVDLVKQTLSVAPQRQVRRLPKGVSMKAVLINEGTDRLRRRTSGRVVVTMTASGASPDYAIEFDTVQSVQYLVVLGLSGQIISTEDALEVQDLL